MDNIKEFIKRVNACSTEEELNTYIDSLVDKQESNYERDAIGIIDGRTLCFNNGYYDFFIKPEIKIRWDTDYPTYHIYDRDYLYEFASYIKRLKLNENTNPMAVAAYVYLFLDMYFGITNSNIDNRGAVLDNYPASLIEKFYSEHNIKLMDDMTAEQQMYLCGDYPISVFKKAKCAKCTERATLAQNILRVCGYDSACMFGELELNGKKEFHSWNAIKVNDNLIFLVDYSAASLVYKDGQLSSVNPYVMPLSKEEFEQLKNGETILELPEIKYEDGERIIDYENKRKYLTGKSFERKQNESKK